MKSKQLSAERVQAITDHENLLQCRSLLGVKDGEILYNVIGEMLSALRWSHNAMQTWFSSEYIEHPETLKVGAILHRKQQQEVKMKIPDTKASECSALDSALELALQNFDDIYPEK